MGNSKNSTLPFVHAHHLYSQTLKSIMPAQLRDPDQSNSDDAQRRPIVEVEHDDQENSKRKHKIKKFHYGRDPQKNSRLFLGSALGVSFTVFALWTCWVQSWGRVEKAAFY